MFKKDRRKISQKKFCITSIKLAWWLLLAGITTNNNLTANFRRDSNLFNRSRKD